MKIKSYYDRKGIRAVFGFMLLSISLLGIFDLFLHIGKAFGKMLFEFSH